MTLGELQSRLERLFAGAGEAGRLAARALAEAEALGRPEFGIRFLAELGQERGATPFSPPAAEKRGAEKRGGAPFSLSDAVTLPAFTGDGARRHGHASATFGPIAAAAVILEAAAVAKSHGVAVVTLAGVRGIGRLAPFAQALAERDLIAVVMVNAPPAVAPHGGRNAVIGTNPIAFAARGAQGTIVADTVTAALTLAALKAHRASGEPLPQGAAMDATGHPTTDPAFAASILPLGGRLGSLAGLLVELLAGIAAGARNDPDGRGLFVLALQPPPGAATAIDDLAGQWRQAGGHLPGQTAPAFTLDKAMPPGFDPAPLTDVQRLVAP